MCPTDLTLAEETTCDFQLEVEERLEDEQTDEPDDPANDLHLESTERPTINTNEQKAEKIEKK